ncbi:MAG: hydantoinase/oxoprolinase family protein, partial [Alphaproteobacteria bacterium]|nr:hydantoinase/oxoprolinase family protein [Alphaproteobacteria bacterium]
HDYVRTVNRPLAELDPVLVSETLQAQIDEGKATIAREGVAVEGITLLHSADMQFQGQSHILSVPLPRLEVTREELHAAFASAYWQRFEVELKEIRPVLVNLHTAVIGRRSAVDLKALARAERRDALAGAQVAERQVWFEGGRRATPIYRRELLPERAQFEGPAIVEQLDTTIVIEPDNRVEMDDYGNLILTILPTRRAE